MVDLIKGRNIYKLAIKPRSRASKCHRWLVFLTGIFALCINTGLIQSLGAFLIEIMDTFDVTRAQAVTVQSACWAVVQISGVMNGAIISRFGPRNSGIVGSFLVSFGMCISFLSSSVPFLYFSLSLCVGLGTSLTHISASTAQGQHFVGRNSAIPLSIFMTGSGIGSVMWTYLLVLLIKIFGLRGTFLLSGGIALNCLAAALVWTAPVNSSLTKTIQMQCKQPKGQKKVNLISVIDVHTKEFDFLKSQEVTWSTVKEEINCNMEMDNTERATYSDRKFETEKTESNEVIVTTSGHDSHELGAVESGQNNIKIVNEPTGILIVVKSMRSILKNKVFMAFNIANMISVQCTGIFLFIAFDLFAEKGYNVNDASVAMVMYSTASLVARACFGVLLKIPYVTRLTVLMFAAFLNFTGCISLLFVKSYPLLALITVAMGISSGFVFASWVVVTVKLVGKDHFANAMGILLTTCGIATAASGPITGHIRDKTGSYTISLIIMSVSLLIAFVILGYAQWMRMRAVRTGNP